MPLSLLHKGRRKWMGRREKSGTSPADGRAQNAGTPPPRAGRAAARRTARPGGRALQASRLTGPGGPVCRPYKNAETCSMNAAGAGPRPARGRTVCAPTEKKRRTLNVLWERESPRRFAAPPFDKGGLAGGGYLGGFFFALRAAF